MLLVAGRHSCLFVDLASFYCAWLGCVVWPGDVQPCEAAGPDSCLLCPLCLGCVAVCVCAVGHHLELLEASTDEEQAEWEGVGYKQIARGRVAAVLIATTTVDSHSLNPKGEDIQLDVEDGTPRVAVPVNDLPSGKSTLQLLAERILKVQQLAAAQTFGRNAPVTRQVQW